MAHRKWHGAMKKLPLQRMAAGECLLQDALKMALPLGGSAIAY
jgi:hypothetical protein